MTVQERQLWVGIFPSSQRIAVQSLKFSRRAERPSVLAGPRHKHHNKRRRVAPDVPKCSTVSKVEREKYAEQLARKVAKVGELFADFAMPELESFASEPEHHRLR